MKETLIDIETYCEADIKKCGLYRYVSDPSFEILLIAWATDDGEGFGETKLADLASGDPFPQELLDDFKDSNVTLIAHNAAFERVSFSRYLQQHYLAWAWGSCRYDHQRYAEGRHRQCLYSAIY